MNFILFRNNSFTFLFTKQKICWIILNRGNQLKFVQKFEQKTNNKASGKVKTDNKTFCKSCGPAHGISLWAHDPLQKENKKG